MNDDRAWPQAPVLAKLPPVARLDREFDPARLLADVQRLTRLRWHRLKTEEEAAGDQAQLGWRTLPLRSLGGDSSATGPGGANLHEFADTPLLRQADYLAELLASIPAPLRGVRLMALAPGAHSPEHEDPRYSFPWGTVRLHVPIVTVADAELILAGQSHVWASGTLWYADFTRPHRVRNNGSTPRIHLVIDTHVTRELLDLFPAVFRRPDVLPDILFDRTRPPPGRAACDALRCRFALPSAAGAAQPDRRPTSRAAIDWYDDRLAMFVEDEPMFGLVHLGDGEFRFAGWTTEQTVQVRANGADRTVTLHMRKGRNVRSVDVPAQALT